MKKLAASLLTLSLLSPTLAMAHPGGHGFNILPDAAAAVVIGGLTYWALNGNYYQKNGDQYVQVQAPPQSEAAPQDYEPSQDEAAPQDDTPPPPQEEEEYDSAPPDLSPIDFHGERFYVSHGHYYKRDPSGQYFEIPRPDGL
ncbi:hypothetical protein [Serratia sp. M24T3]|uniref:Uncharacterized protein n=1 Tax=Rouxiella sp. WC2420 TaxID=3234145 RepID=A0AB39VSC8_9GAMM|nr:hypothetical protein [Serratia sp. M24T3]EIC82662.1 hypothetical protein SPM24T3_20584 [Serratia sp. M24T3]